MCNYLYGLSYERVAMSQRAMRKCINMERSVWPEDTWPQLYGQGHVWRDLAIQFE